MRTVFGMIAASIIVALTLAWLLRYDMMVGSEPLVVYSMDRWTGEISFVAPKQTVQSISELEFSRTPLLRLRGPSVRDRITKPLFDEPE